MDTRLHTLQAWLKKLLKISALELQPLSGDASFRRYFRLACTTGNMIAVDAPPLLEDSRKFVVFARIMAKLSVKVPVIYAADLASGFLLVTDFGDKVYWRELKANKELAPRMYELAFVPLVKLQYYSAHSHWPLAHFNEQFMRHELANFETWFLQKYLNINLSPSLLNKSFDFLVASATAQPQVCIHRDYHSRNLMLLEDDMVGVLDFQDIMWGPITYDIVSLLKDCYIDWPLPQVESWVKQFYQQLVDDGCLTRGSFEQFWHWFNLMGMQRHLKAIFIFARKFLRDQVSDYLADIPRGLNYILATSQHYPQLQDFYAVLQEIVIPRWQQVYSQNQYIIIQTA